MDTVAQRGQSADWFVRAQHHRNTAEGDKSWMRLTQSEALGAVEFVLPAAPDRPTRTVRHPLYVSRHRHATRTRRGTRSVLAILYFVLPLARPMR